MDNSRILIYDGTFNGFLSAVFVGFNENMEVVDFQKSTFGQNGLFEETKIVPTQLGKAKRVWNSIERKSSTAIRNIYFAFLSESKGIEHLLFTYIKGMFSALDAEKLNEFGDLEQRIIQLTKNVNKEKRQTEALMEFNFTDAPIYITEIEPTHNILPLISRHFRLRHPKHHWIIFDCKRNYGVYYNMNSVEIIDFETKAWYQNSNVLSSTFTKGSYRFAV